jgi:hypothetical protein
LFEFNGREIGFPFKDFTEGLWMLKTQLIRYFRNRQGAGGQEFFCFFDQLLMEMLLGYWSGH